jgi:hypothetical protein
MKGDTFECPPPCIKPPQWPFGHVEVARGRGEGRCGLHVSMDHRTMEREEEHGNWEVIRKGATATRKEIKEGMKK